METNEPRGWHSRGYLPHIDAGAVPAIVTYRLSDALPAAVLLDIEEQMNTLPEQVRPVERYRKVDSYLDRGGGDALLARPDVASLAEEPLLFHDGQRYTLHAWVVMPNHVHALITPLIEVGEIIRTWKSFSAWRIHQLLGGSGAMWQPDYFERLIRDQEHFNRVVEYIHRNPVKAGLCRMAEDWRFGSAARLKRSL